LPLLRFADAKAAASHILAIEAIDGSLAEFSGGKGDKGKSAGTTSLAVHGDVEVDNGTEVRKKRTNFVLVGCEGQIAHVEFHLNIQELRTDKLNAGRRLWTATLGVTG
jgi:hypothetical protein